jgi:hypothetical protein
LGVYRTREFFIVVNAIVTVVNTVTSFTSKTPTSAQGTYYVPYLAPGAYRLTVEAAGFKRYVRDEILVSSGEVPRIDLQLEVGAMAACTTSYAVAEFIPARQFFQAWVETSRSPCPSIAGIDAALQDPTRLRTSSAMVPLVRGTMRPAVHAHLGFVRNYCEPAEQDREQGDNGLPPSQNEEKVIRMRWNRLRSRILAAGDCRRFRSDAGADPPNRSKGVSKTTQRRQCTAPAAAVGDPVVREPQG